MKRPFESGKVLRLCIFITKRIARWVVLQKRIKFCAHAHITHAFRRSSCQNATLDLSQPRRLVWQCRRNQERQRIGVFDFGIFRRHPIDPLRVGRYRRVAVKIRDGTEFRGAAFQISFNKHDRVEL